MLRRVVIHTRDHILQPAAWEDFSRHTLLVGAWPGSRTGTAPRTYEGITQCDPGRNPILNIQDASGSWKCQVNVQTSQDVRCVLQQVAPQMEPRWIYQIRLNGGLCKWSSKVMGGQLIVFPFKLKKILVVPEEWMTFTPFCDHFDTVASIMAEHPILNKFKRSPWFHLDFPSQQVVIMEPSDFVLDFPFHCWTLHSDYQVTQQAISVKIPKCIDLEAHEIPKNGTEARENHVHSIHWQSIRASTCLC